MPWYCKTAQQLHPCPGSLGQRSHYVKQPGVLFFRFPPHILAVKGRTLSSGFGIADRSGTAKCLLRYTPEKEGKYGKFDAVGPDCPDLPLERRQCFTWCAGRGHYLATSSENCNHSSIFWSVKVRKTIVVYIGKNVVVSTRDSFVISRRALILSAPLTVSIRNNRNQVSHCFRLSI